MESYTKFIKVLKKIKIGGGRNHRATPCTLSATYTIQYPPETRVQVQRIHIPITYGIHVQIERTIDKMLKNILKRTIPQRTLCCWTIEAQCRWECGTLPVMTFILLFLSCCCQFKNKFSLKQVAIKVKCTGELFIYLFYKEEKQNRRIIYDRYRIGMWAPTFHAYNYWTQRQLTPFSYPLLLWPFRLLIKLPLKKIKIKKLGSFSFFVKLDSS